MFRGPDPIVLNQLNIVVRDMDATVAFYRRLGLPLMAEAGAQHAAITLPNGLLVEFDSEQFVPQWNTGWRGTSGGGVVLGFTVPSRAAVDALYADLTGAGYRGQQRPYDAFWGARYAIVEDPDGNSVGLMSPIDDQRRTWPPTPPPATA
jgi:catechol 2,3-dioxygenase-like lactoylglutathione lyase family enzyme